MSAGTQTVGTGGKVEIFVSNVGMAKGGYRGGDRPFVFGILINDEVKLERGGGLV